MDPPESPRPSPWRYPLVGAAGLGAWTLLDLLLRVDLPGASEAAHLAFRAVVVPLRWLRVRTEHPLPVGLSAWLLLLPLTWRRPRLLAAWLGASAAVLAAAELLTVSLALLMERSAALGIAVATAVAVRLGGAPPAGPRDARARWTELAGTIAAAGGCLVLIALLYDTRADYPMIAALGERLRAGETAAATFAVAAGAVAPVGGGILLRRIPGRGAALAGGATAGLAVALATRALPPGDVAAWWPLALSVPAGMLLLLLGAPLLPPAGSGRWTRPTAWPLLLLPLVPAAGLLFAQAYATRILVCPAPTPGLERIAALPEVFEIALNEEGTTALLAVRGSAQLLSMQLLPEPSAPVPVEPGPAAGPPDVGRPGALLGRPEEVVHLPSTGGWLATLVPEGVARGADAVEARFASGGACDAVGDFGNLLVDVGPDAARVERAGTWPDLCWVSSARWDPVAERLLVGWEYRPGLHRLDPATGAASAHPLGAGVGDVIAIAPDPDPDAGRLFAASLWTSRYLTELDRDSLAPRRRAAVGGTNYDVAYEPARDRVFVSSFYASRVRTVDAATMERTGSLPTGFGTRALALLPRLDLLVASSTYDGVLRFWDLESGALVGALPVGGHVKDLAADPERGLLYFWSQCGLFRLDVAAFVGAAG